MSTPNDTPSAPDPRPPVSLRGLLSAAEALRAELAWTRNEPDLAYRCYRGGVEIQITAAAASPSTRVEMVRYAARVIDARATVHRYTHSAAAEGAWGYYSAHGHFMEAPVWVWTHLTADDAKRAGVDTTANVITLPTNGGPR